MAETIKCTIRTPQFEGGEVKEWKVQMGTFIKATREFIPYDISTGHRVQFDSVNQFEKFRISDHFFTQKVNP